jgi:hypothetical protein
MIKACVKYSLLMLKNPLILIEFLMLTGIIVLWPEGPDGSFFTLTSISYSCNIYVPIFLLYLTNLSINITTTMIMSKIPLGRYFAFSFGNLFFYSFLYSTVIHALIFLRCGTTADASLLWKLWVLSILCFLNASLLYRALQHLTGIRSIGFVLILFIVVYEGLSLTLFSAYSKIPILMTPAFSGKTFEDSILQILPLLMIYTGLFGASLLLRKEEI